MRFTELKSGGVLSVIAGFHHPVTILDSRATRIDNAFMHRVKLENRELQRWSMLIIVAALGIAVACSSKSSRDADWEEVLKAATRVESGLRHEALIALRSKVADLDAAVANYTRHYPDGSKEQRVRSINQAVDALEWGIDHEKAEEIWRDGTDGFGFYSARQYLNAEPTCVESEGKLYVSGIALSHACLAYAQSALLDPEKPSALHPRDFKALRTKCSSDYENYQKNLAQQAQIAAQQAEAKRLEELQQAEAKRLEDLQQAETIRLQDLRQAEARRAQRLRDYPLHVDVISVGASSVEDPFDLLSAIDDGALSGSGLSPDESRCEGGRFRFFQCASTAHFEAKRKVRLQIPKKDRERVLVRVNGTLWTPTWSDVGPFLETTITLER